VPRGGELHARQVVLEFDGVGTGGDIDFEKDLGLNDAADTFWIDGTRRVGRRHQLKLGFPQVTGSP